MWSFVLHELHGAYSRCIQGLAPEGQSLKASMNEPSFSKANLLAKLVKSVLIIAVRL